MLFLRLTTFSFVRFNILDANNFDTNMWCITSKLSMEYNPVDGRKYDRLKKLSQNFVQQDHYHTMKMIASGCHRNPRKTWLYVKLRVFSQSIPPILIENKAEVYHLDPRQKATALNQVLDFCVMWAAMQLSFIRHSRTGTVRTWKTFQSGTGDQKQFNDHLKTRKLLYNRQSAFRNQHSCETLLLKITEAWKKAIDSRQYIAVAFLDRRKPSKV